MLPPILFHHVKLESYGACGIRHVQPEASSLVFVRQVIAEVITLKKLMKLFRGFLTFYYNDVYFASMDPFLVLGNQ